MDEDYGFIIDSMRWSFSRLNYHCPYEWKCKYIDCEWGESSFFAQYGSWCHQLLEDYAKGKISIFEISQLYENGFDENITYDAPPNKYTDIRQSYFEKGLEYFENLDLELEKYEILGVEKEVNFKIDDKDFIGYIDLLLRDKETCEIIILDHKSASLKFKKNGEISKTDAAHFLEFKRQLYLYSLAVMEEYGRVDFLEWNMFRDQKKVRIPWKQEEYDEAIEWAKNTIKLIAEETEWRPSPDFYYCHYLCSQRHNCCEYKER